MSSARVSSRIGGSGSPCGGMRRPVFSAFVFSSSFSAFIFSSLVAIPQSAQSRAQSFPCSSPLARCLRFRQKMSSARRNDTRVRSAVVRGRGNRRKKGRREGGGGVEREREDGTQSVLRMDQTKCCEGIKTCCTVFALCYLPVSWVSDCGKESRWHGN
jgi:hypothetical protein